MNLRFFIIWLAIFAGSLFVTPILLIGSDTFITKRTPKLIKAYGLTVLGQKIEIKDIESLRKEAGILHEQGKYSESVLNSTAAIEHELRRQLNLKTTYPFRLLMHRLARLNFGGIAPDILWLAKIRDLADGGKVNEEDSKRSIKLVDELFQMLSRTDSLILDA